MIIRIFKLDKDMNYILKEIVLKSFMQIETLFEDSSDYNDAKTQYGTSIVHPELFIHIFKTDDKIIKDSEKVVYS